mgnify:CR=1 FL=1
MKKLMIFSAFLSFFLISLPQKVFAENLRGIPRSAINTKPPHLSKNDALDLYKNQNTSLAITFIDKERDYIKIFDVLPIYPKKAFDVTYEQVIEYKNGWNIMTENIVSRKESKNQWSAPLCVASFCLIVFLIARILSGFRIFSSKNRTEYGKVTLTAGMFAILALLFFTLVVAKIDPLHQNIYDCIFTAGTWGMFTLATIYRMYKVERSEVGTEPTSSVRI